MITGGFGQVQRHAYAGTKTLIELKIDFARRSWFGMDFFCHGETRGGVCKIAGPLQLNPPEIQTARVKGSGKNGILILFRGAREIYPGFVAPTARGIEVERCDCAFNGGERLRFHPRPELPGSWQFDFCPAMAAGACHWAAFLTCKPVHAAPD